MIATLALMAMLPSLTVNAVRESTGKFLQDHRDHSERLFTKCRSAKCSSQSFELSGDGGRLLFEECQVKENQPLETASGETMCQETCTVRDSKDQPRTVTVWHKSGHGLQVCQLQVGYDFCEDTCCRSKCSGQSYELKTEWKGQWQFQDCELKGSFGSGYRTLCAEKCTVVHTKESQQVLVLRESGPEPQCELQKVGFPEMAIQFVEQLEHDALKITDGEYWRLPLMEAKKIKFFLSKVKEDVLMPEFQAAEGHGASREISTEVKHVAIIGDLHGQLFNLIAHLIRIKETYKDKGFIPLDGSSLLFCDPRMQYIFLGDYVDRGERGIELLLLLLAYKARCPQGLILLNGNHEDPSVFESYGFLEELQTKFDDNPITQQVIDVLQILPYVAVVPGNFMAMHGGITPAFVKACTGKAGRFGKCLDRYIADMSAWADPHKGNGWIPSHRGEYIYEFGMDEAKAFLQSNGLKGIFRGHEQVETGHTSMVYDGYYVTTVFSAADYVDTFCRGQEPPWMFGAAGEGNSGAFVLVDLTDGTVTHQAMSGSKTRALAAQFTGAKCHGSWLETGSHQSRSIESFMQENHKRLAHGNTSCTLDQTEVDSFKEEVRKILSTSKDQASQEFEARKLIDLQGEALTHGESIEICRSMKKDHITLEVYNELRGTDEEILENDIKVREIELEESDVDT